MKEVGKRYTPVMKKTRCQQMMCVSLLEIGLAKFEEYR